MLSIRQAGSPMLYDSATAMIQRAAFFSSAAENYVYLYYCIMRKLRFNQA